MNLPLYQISYYLHFISEQIISFIYSRLSFGLSLLVGFLTHSCIMSHIQTSLILVTKLLIQLHNTNFLLTWKCVSWDCFCMGNITHLVESPCPILLDQPTKTLPMSMYFSSTTFSYLGHCTTYTRWNAMMQPPVIQEHCLSLKLKQGAGQTGTFDISGSLHDTRIKHTTKNTSYFS